MERFIKNSYSNREGSPKLINDLAITVQLIQDNKQNIGISPIRTKFNQERIESIINKLMVLQDEVIENEQG
ncbi:hypothetical protein [Floccifex porci]|uniref:Uncharacterized protein n=1 Tax=Floccifex porci TaxID=2606629 RepID=A0A7X2N3T0_9FIRM|nr:hypothetical protein [Floccifex porci]MSS01964.1 hypothetical protein [Floccifex porci]